MVAELLGTSTNNLFHCKIPSSSFINSPWTSPELEVPGCSLLELVTELIEFLAREVNEPNVEAKRLVQPRPVSEFS